VFDYGTQVTLTATPASGVAGFGGWSGGGCNGTGTCVVNMTAPTTVAATFKTLATWDPAWSLAGVTYTNGNLSIAYGSGSNTKNVRTTFGKTSGKMYWEVTATAGSSSSNGGGLGIAEAVMPNNANFIGSVPSGVSFGYGGGSSLIYFISWSGTSVNGAPASTSPVNAGITYMFALDMTVGSFWAGHNGTWYNGGDPAANASAAVTGLTGTVFPAVTLYASSLNAFTANFGGKSFQFPVPNGFQAGFF